MDCYQHRGTSDVLSFPPAAGDKLRRARTERDDFPLVLQEVNHRIRNILAMIEAVVGQTQSTTVEEYRAKLMGRLSGLSDFYELISRLDAGKLGLAALLEQTMRPYCAVGSRVFAGGPDVDIEPKLALLLHLVIHELACNASKYGALSSECGTVKVAWDIRRADGAQKLAIVWSEDGGPQVKQPQRWGFGSRLIARAFESYGEVRLDFRPVGVACYMLLDLERDVGACG